MFFKRSKVKSKPFIRQGGVLFKFKIFRALRRAFAYCVAQGLKIYWKTLRFEYENDAKQLLSDASKPTLAIIWHNNLLSASSHSKLRSAKKLYAIISAGTIGAWISDVFKALGLGVVRGSRNLRGKQALRELLQKLQRGHDVIVTPDGSRGPVYKMKAGPALLAKKTQCAILLVNQSFSCAWRLPSWDRFVIPLPFSKVIVRARYYQNISELTDSQEIDVITKVLEEKMLEITHL